MTAGVNSVYVDAKFYNNLQGDNNSAISRLKQWFEEENQPLFVVTGHGGIGKTTLAKQFLDYLYDYNSKYGLLFIDSRQIINQLSKNFTSDNKISELFDFYNALMDIDDDDDEVRFSKDLLKLSIDNGSLIVVLDGIDEVIAKIGERFDISSFINSIYEEYSSDMHMTKILITCRDHFWNEIGQKVDIPEIELQPFNRDLAEEFFNQEFQSDSKKISRAMIMADTLAVENNPSQKIEELSKAYIPFLLDLIGYLVREGSIYNEKEYVKSELLEKNNHTDQLIGRICEREIIKLESINVEEQLKLFMRIASQKENKIHISDIKSIFNGVKSDIVSSKQKCYG